MNTLQRLVCNMISKNLHASKQFYTSLFGFEVAFESDWFINLASKDNVIELGILLEGHEIAPKGARAGGKGMYITFVVDDVEQVWAKAKTNNFSVLEEPKDTFYGQQRMLLEDPNGLVVDVSSKMA